MRAKKTTLRWAMITLTTIAAMFAVPARCRAQVQCPWLNAATAGGVLGGEAKLTVSPPTPLGDVNCQFVRTVGSQSSTISIAVHTMGQPSKDFAGYLAGCSGTTIRLRKIGNEAVQCVFKGPAVQGQEQVIARVRDRVFVMVIKAGTAVPNGLSEEAENLAEQVAGALF